MRGIVECDEILATFCVKNSGYFQGCIRGEIKDHEGFGVSLASDFPYLPQEKPSRLMEIGAAEVKLRFTSFRSALRIDGENRSLRARNGAKFVPDAQTTSKDQLARRIAQAGPRRPRKSLANLINNCSALCVWFCAPRTTKESHFFIKRGGGVQIGRCANHVIF